jgi:peptidylprolyl isomerase
MKKTYLLSLVLAGQLLANEPTAPTGDIEKISEAFGHLIGKNIENLGLKFDMERIVKGLQDASQGKESPMSEMECIQAIAAVQEGNFKKTATENLKKAEEFLSTQATTQGVTTLEEGKVLYKVEQTGSGAAVEAHFSPLLRYTGKFMDGTVFGASKEDELLSLDETIPGLTKGLIGMKEGEKRTVYIHPDFAYGTSGALPPNSLLSFEVELIKANAPQAKDGEALSTGSSKTNAEIATPASAPQSLR